MRKITVIFCMLMLLCIVGCKEEVPEKKGPVISTSSYVAESTTAVSEEPTETTSKTQQPAKEMPEEKRGKGQIVKIVGEGEAERLGVKKTLIWVTANSLNETKVKILNERLVNEYGCDFVVEFHEYDWYVDFNKDVNYNHAKMILDMKTLGHQADVVYSGNQNEFSALVEEGIYIPLDEYFATEEGQKLYNAYAPEIWKKTMRDGKTYGYYSGMYPSGRSMALCNNELAKQYGVTLPEGEWSFYDMGTILETAGITATDIADNEELFCCNPKALLAMEGYHELRQDPFEETGILFKSDDNGKWIAINPVEEEVIIELWKKVKEYADKGWYSGWNNDTAKSVQLGRFVFYFADFATSDGSDVVGNKYIINNRKAIYDVTIGRQEYGVSEPQENCVVGVASWSEYKDEALKLITLINTDKALSNLIMYGVEGEDYLYEDKRLYRLPEMEMLNTAIFPEIANINLLHSIFIEPEDKLTYSKEVAVNSPSAPTMLYDIDVNAYEGQISRISGIYTRYAELLFSGECEDVDTIVAKMDEELSAAGINEIVAEINRQMREQEASK